MFQLFFRLSHLVRHLNTVLVEPLVIVGFPWRPVSEGHLVLVRPCVHTSQKEVIQASPHITAGCKRPKKKF